MKSNKYMFFFVLLLLPIFLAGCGKRFPDYSSQSGSLSTEESKTAANGTDDHTSDPAEPTIHISTTESSGIEDTAGETDSSSSSDPYEVRAGELLSGMTLEEKVGQMFFVRLRKASAVQDIEKYHLGGYILFGDDFKDETQTGIQDFIKSCQNASSLPLLMGVDEEGGTVCRVSKYAAFRSEPFKSPQDLYKQGGFEAIQADTREKAALLLGLGINVNLAPVCDVSVNPDDFIYSRSFGREAGETADYVRTVVREMEKAGIGSTLKHFPGYGSNEDTHTGSAVDTRDYKQFLQSDFLPFEAGIEAGAGSVLVSHNIVTSMDEEHPASLSRAVHDKLRESLNFKGVIMTDDLSMDAIKNSTSNAAVLAIAAGNDLLIATDFVADIPAVLDALNNGTLKEAQIDASVIRILVWKLKLDIL
ncbi:MAG: beta-hexosaminidase [Hungatella sp.]|jgi:beta-N-acetylhexosaminidase|nr:beta-hexosaminidase [Hungatella sp.]